MKFNIIKSGKILLILFFIFALVLIQTQSTSFAAGQSRIDSQRKQTKAKINHLKWLEHLETHKLYKNQQKLEQTTSDLQNTREDYSNAQAKLSQLQGDLAKSMGEFSRMDYKMRNRIRQIYKTQRHGFFELILEAQDFNSFLDRIYFESIVIKNDYKNMVHARQKAKEIARLKHNIEQQKRYISRSIKEINYQQATIQREIDRNQNMIQKLRTDRVTYERAEKELARQSSSIQSMISRSTYHGDDSAVVSSGFIKPIAGRITSPFGWRIHPIFKSRSFHSGVDIAGPYNGGVRASNSGRVIYVGWYGGYGKVVMIDHGKINGIPVTTLYAHLNSFDVAKGQMVSKGQIIGREGTTGYSTGPHVHFEVRLNGKPNNPLHYI